MYYRGTFSNTRDCTETGVYYNLGGDAEGLPPDLGKQVMMTVVKCPYLFEQEVTSYITGRVYKRIVNLFHEDWGSWLRIDNA